MKLQDFIGKRMTITCFNIKCVEDIDDIRQHLITQYGGEITETDNEFIVNGRQYTKPWLPRVREGIFQIYGNQYYIEIESSSTVGRMKPRRSFYPLSKLQIIDEHTLVTIIDAEKDHRIEYRVTE